MGFDRVTFKRVNFRALEEHVLHSVLLELTYRCNLNCFFCYNDLELSGRELQLADYEGLLEDLAEMQVMFLTLSGGEPLASPHFWSVARRARELGFVVRLKTNGHAIDASLARRLKTEVDPYNVETSLHGARGETHDRQTRVPGSFERLVRNLGEMKAAGLRLWLNSTLTRWNEAEVEAMFALADGLGLRLRFDPVVTPRDNGDRGPLAVTASRAGVERLFRILEERQRERLQAGEEALVEVGQHNDVGLPSAPGKNCGAGATNVAIDPFGNVYPCVQWRRGVGNLHERSIREIWTTSRELARVQELNAEAAGIDRGEGMSFCLGLAEELTGDPLKAYAPFEKNREALDAVRGKVSLPVVS